METSEIPDLLLLIWKKWRTGSPVGQGVITQEQYWVLRTLERSGPQRLKDLANKLGCTPSTASIVVKRLEKSKLVLRKRSREDEREVRVDLTRPGLERLGAWRRNQLTRLSRLFDDLTATERKDLERLLRRVLAQELEIAYAPERGRKE